MFGFQSSDEGRFPQFRHLTDGQANTRDIQRRNEAIIPGSRDETQPPSRAQETGQDGDSPSFLTSFLSFFIFFRASMSMHGMPLALASSTCLASARMQILRLGRAVCGSLTVPLKRLSLEGS